MSDPIDLDMQEAADLTLAKMTADRIRAYPKFQISKFLDDKRDYQVVVRTDSFESLKKAMEQIKPLITSMESNSNASKTSPKSYDIEDGSKCKDCGADRVKNPKTGKWFCSEKCWLK